MLNLEPKLKLHGLPQVGSTGHHVRSGSVKMFFKNFFSKFFFQIFFSGSVEFTTVPAAGGGGVISNTAVPGMSSSSDVTITRAPNAHGGAPGGVHAQSSLGNGFASQVQPTSLGQKIFDRPNKDKVK